MCDNGHQSGGVIVICARNAILLRRAQQIVRLTEIIYFLNFSSYQTMGWSAAIWISYYPARMTDMDNHEDSIERIFGLTLNLPPAERAAFLDYICCNTPEVRKAVEELLLEDDCAGSFLKKPILSPASTCATTLQVVPTSELVGPGFKSKTFRFKPGDTVASRFVVLRLSRAVVWVRFTKSRIAFFGALMSRSR